MTQTPRNLETGLTSYPFNPEGIPDELRERPQWVNWKYARRDEKWTKVPYGPQTFERASSTDLMTWESFDEAMMALRVGEFDGIGFVFCSADPFVGIDFDDCRNPRTGEIDEEVLEFVRSFESSYVEMSVSGTGVHLITTGRCREGKKVGKRELYGQDRFFCMTGMELDV
jgi:putative DNA primase/helicase